MTLAARSIAEEHLYMRLHPCRCGERVDVGSLGHATFIADDNHLISSFSGACSACGAAHEFSFLIRDDAPKGHTSFGGSEPSTIIDPGEFSIASLELAKQGDFDRAIACLEEVIKFIPPGEDSVPAACFKSAAGARARLDNAGSFARRVLEARIAAFRERRAGVQARSARARTTTATRVLRVHNSQPQPMELLLEPSGHCFEMPPGSMFEVFPQQDEELEIYHQSPDLMVSGFVAKVVHDGEVLASWTDVDEHTTRADDHPERISSADELRAFLMASGEQIIREPDGALILRPKNRKPWTARVRWRDEQDLVHVEAPTWLRAPVEREAALALAISRIHATNAIPGFRIIDVPGGKLGVTYWVILMMEEGRSVKTTVLLRALDVCFRMVMRYLDRLEAVANGRPDPGFP